MNDVEGLSSDEDDEDLATDHDNIDSQEEPIVEDALENIQFVVQAAIARFIRWCS